MADKTEVPIRDSLPGPDIPHLRDYTGVPSPVASTSQVVDSSNDVATEDSSIDEDICIIKEKFNTGRNNGIEMRKLEFSANISTMFTDVPFLQRFQRAKDCGFNSVEFHNPYEHDLEDLAAAMGTMKVDLVNMYNGEHLMGCAANPRLEEFFVNSFQNVIKYHFRLGFKKLHIQTGMRLPEYTYEEQRAALVRNLKNVADSCVLSDRKITGLIEPICPAVKEGYFLNSFKQAKEIIDEVNCKDHILLLFDVYHAHEINGGHVLRDLERYKEIIGHFQVSQSPGRGHPFSDGEINYDEVFKKFQEVEVPEFPNPIGLECNSSGNAEDYRSIVQGYKW